MSDAATDPSTSRDPGASVDVAIVPKWVEGSVGIYTDESIDLFKELRAVGIRVAFSHPPERRKYVTYKGDIPIEFAISVVEGLLTSAIWLAICQAVKRLMSAKSNPEVDANIFVKRIDSSGNTYEKKIEYRGDGNTLMSLLHDLKAHNEDA